MQWDAWIKRRGRSHSTETWGMASAVPEGAVRALWGGIACTGWGAQELAASSARGSFLYLRTPFILDTISVQPRGRVIFFVIQAVSAGHLKELCLGAPCCFLILHWWCFMLLKCLMLPLHVGAFVWEKGKIKTSCPLGLPWFPLSFSAQLSC